MQIVDVLKTVVAVGSQLGSVVQMVEGMVPVGTAGADKLAMVRDIINRSIAAVQTAQAAFDMAWPILEPLVHVIVDRFNKDGTFTHAVK